jgi:hypothetical protein
MVPPRAGLTRPPNAEVSVGRYSPTHWPATVFDGSGRLATVAVRDYAGDRGVQSDCAAGVLDSQNDQSPSGSVVCPTSIR